MNSAFDGFYCWGEEDEELELDEDSWDCCFPDECLMPGFHHKSECFTAEMVQWWEEINQQETADV